MSRILASFFRLGTTMWVLFSFIASFALVYQVMRANGVNPLNIPSEIPALGVFLVISIIGGFVTALTGLLLSRWVFHWVEG